MKVNVNNLVKRLKSGNPSAEDLEQAAELAKSLAAGDITPESLDGLSELRKAMGGECDEDDDEEGEEGPVKKAVEAAPAPAPAAAPTQTLEQQMQQNPDTSRAINAVAPLQMLVKSFDSLVEMVEGLQTEVATMRSENATLQKSLAAIAERPTVAPPAVIPAQIGNDTADALVKALQATGLIDRLDRLETTVDKRAHSNHPSRTGAAAAVNGANGAGVTRGLRKDQAIEILQKSVQLNRITSDQAGNALAQLDIAESAIRRGEVNYGLDTVVRQFDPQTLKEFAGI